MSLGSAVPMRRSCRWRRTLALSLLEIAALLLAHRLLIVEMAGRDVISHILSAGSHVPRTTMVLVTTFLVVRLLAVLALPGMILSRIGLIVMDAIRPTAGGESGDAP